jgi:hypothetical protein
MTLLLVETPLPLFPFDPVLDPVLLYFAFGT